MDELAVTLKSDKALPLLCAATIMFRHHLASQDWNINLTQTQSIIGTDDIRVLANHSGQF